MGTNKVSETFRKVYCKEQTPEKDGEYDTNLGCLRWDENQFIDANGIRFKAEWYYESIQEPKETSLDAEAFLKEKRIYESTVIHECVELPTITYLLKNLLTEFASQANKGYVNSKNEK